MSPIFQQPDQHERQDDSGPTSAQRARLRAEHERLLAVPPAERTEQEWRTVHQRALCTIAEALAKRLAEGEAVSTTDLTLAAIASAQLK